VRQITFVAVSLVLSLFDYFAGIELLRRAYGEGDSLGFFLFSNKFNLFHLNISNRAHVRHLALEGRREARQKGLPSMGVKASETVFRPLTSLSGRPTSKASTLARGRGGDDRFK
jgi:hypothetical protein